MRYKIVIDDLVKPDSCVMGKQFNIKVKLHQELEQTDDPMGYRLAFGLSKPKGKSVGGFADKRDYEELPTVFNDEGGIE